MCGIVGYIGNQACVDILFPGLKRLEYRGYDSSGIAVEADGKIAVVKQEGKLQALEPLLASLPGSATRGIGHTRWATHGPPTVNNAHPHVAEGVALVHNGIVENYNELKDELIGEGVSFQSETDSEVVLRLLVREFAKNSDHMAAILQVVGRLQGAFSLGIMIADEPDRFYLVKEGSPLVVGLGQGESFFASDALAIVNHTNKACFLNDGEVATVTAEGMELRNFAGEVQPMKFHFLDMANANAEKAGFRHFMLKEVHEQPRVMGHMLKNLVDFSADLSRVRFDEKRLGLLDIDLDRVKSINMVACGTAYYSCLVGKYFLEPLCQIPVNVELASEFRYRDPWIDGSALTIAVSQSGETADTLACVKHARAQGAQIMSICNVQMSSIPRASDVTLYMEAGPEIGVASTKAFTSMLLSHFLFGLGFAVRRGRLGEDDLRPYANAMRSLPTQMDRAVDTARVVEEIAGRYYDADHFIFMGRGLSFGIALEGALKLKEISYIHAEGYAGGELKHGPIALIDRNMPIVAIAPQDLYYEKMISNIEEVKAREGRVIAVGSAHDDKLRQIADDFIPCPESPDLCLQSILSVVPLQLLAYYVAVKRGTDVDQPRNLAKSVTVE